MNLYYKTINYNFRDSISINKNYIVPLQMFSTPSQKNNQSNEKKIYTQSGQSRIKAEHSKSKTNLTLSNVKYTNPSNKNKSVNAYHFSNAIYQGEMKTFHRSGKGILLHDNGLTGIIKSSSNRLKDHCIFFGQNLIISVIYK